MLGLAVVLLDGDARVLGDRLLELGDALFEGLLVRRLLDGRLDEAGLLARVRRDEKDSEGAVADREAPADVAARALGPRQLATARAVVGADRVALRGVRERPTLQAGRACGGRAGVSVSVPTTSDQSLATISVALATVFVVIDTRGDAKPLSGRRRPPAGCSSA